MTEIEVTKCEPRKLEYNGVVYDWLFTVRIEYIPVEEDEDNERFI